MKKIVALSLLCLLAASSLDRSGSALAGGSSVLKSAPSDARRVPLAGNLHPLAQARYDRGAVPGTLEMVELKFVLRRSPGQEAALATLLSAQQKPTSQQYRKWLTPAQFGDQFGASDQDIQIVTAWLQSHAFKVGEMPAGRTSLPFSGTAAQVEAAFATPIHYFSVDGIKHFANTENPQIPAALQPLISGIRGLHDFRAKSNASVRKVSAPDYLAGGTNYVGPVDFAVIYNIGPLFFNNVRGDGITVAVAGQSDIDPSVLTDYWAAFSVTQKQQFSSVAAAAATDPGRSGDGNESEAYIDVEIISVVAPDAKVVLIRDKSVITAFEYAINNNLAPILNVSFSTCEKSLGSANASINSAFQQAVAQGMTVVVSAGDSGIADCDDATRNTAGDAVVSGLSVNGMASTPYDIAVGGTDFNPMFVSKGSYWETTNTPAFLYNAKSYIPEMVWNPSCANPVMASLAGASNPLAFCNDPSHASLERIDGGGGGFSSCISVSSSGVCNGGYAVPSWQTGVVGTLNMTARAIPDVSLLASDWVGCDQNSDGCSLSTQSLEIFSGTSLAAPGLSGMIALLDEVLATTSNPDGRQGNLNPTLYRLAAAEYGSPSNPITANLNSCNSNNGAAIPTTCVFNDITMGSNAQPCTVSKYAAADSRPLSTCTSASGYTYGIVNSSGTSVAAYGAAPGYDLASGLGSVDASVLVEYVAGLEQPTNLHLSGSGSTVNLAWTGLAQAQSYNVYQGTTALGESSTPIQSGITGTTATVTGLLPGHPYFFYVTATVSTGITYPCTEATINLVPATPTSVAAVGTQTSITLSWSASDGADTYQLLMGSKPGGEGAQPVASGITGTSYSMTGMVGTPAYIQVVAVNEGGASAASSEVVANVLPLSPTSVAATGGSGSVTLSWTAGKGASSYNIYEGSSAGKEGTTAVMTNVSGTTAQVSGLGSSKAYYFYVASANSAGISSPSNEATATTSASSGGGGSMRLAELLFAGLLVLGRFALPVTRRQRHPG